MAAHFYIQFGDVTAPRRQDSVYRVAQKFCTLFVRFIT